MCGMYCQPHFRKKFFDDPKFTWSVEYNKFGDEFYYFFYILKKVCLALIQFLYQMFNCQFLGSLMGVSVITRQLSIDYLC